VGSLEESHAGSDKINRSTAPATPWQCKHHILRLPIKLGHMLGPEFTRPSITPGRGCLLGGSANYDQRGWSSHPAPFLACME